MYARIHRCDFCEKRMAGVNGCTFTMIDHEIIHVQNRNDILNCEIPVPPTFKRLIIAKCSNISYKRKRYILRYKHIVSARVNFVTVIEDHATTAQCHGNSTLSIGQSRLIIIFGIKHSQNSPPFPFSSMLIVADSRCVPFLAWHNFILVRKY